MNKVQVMLVILITVFLSRAIDVRETSIKDICRDLNDNENNTFEKAKRDKMNLVLEEIMKEDKVIYKKKDRPRSAAVMLTYATSSNGATTAALFDLLKSPSRSWNATSVISTPIAKKTASP